jgi:uncharacterized protein YdaU (DUF1376 family)
LNYYPFHLGDYAAHTAHLEPMEDLAYRRMLDLYYRTEKPLPRELADIARLIRMKGHETEIQSVLGEFFELGPEGWGHGRCDKEITAYQRMGEGGRRGAAKRWSKPSDSHPIATPSDPQCQPRTNNQEPITTIAPKEHRARKSADHPNPGVDPQVWEDWKALRKAKRAPVTQTVIDGATAEANKAGMPLEAFLRIWCQRGSQGLQAEWLKPEEKARKSDALMDGNIAAANRYMARQGAT